MIHLFNVVTCLGIVVLQSTVKTYVPFFDRFYDLLIPFIIYLGVFRHARESLIVVLFFGFIMDNISGGPFGLYLTTYLWLFLGIRWMIKFVHIRQSLLILVVVAFGVAMENFVFVATLAAWSPGFQFRPATIGLVITQLLLAVLTGPFLLIFFENAYNILERYFVKIAEEGNN